MANSGRTLQGIEAHAPDAPRVKDLLISIAPLTLSGEAISGCVVPMVDLSQRKIAERQQLLMMRELDPRRSKARWQGNEGFRTGTSRSASYNKKNKTTQL